MKYLSLQQGFTLIEIMIVLAIIGILVAFAIPSYQSYIISTQNSACLSEVKGYSNHVFYEINDQDDSTSPIAPVVSACESITDATGWTLLTQQKILATAKSPSNSRVECDIPNGTPCVVLP